MTVINAENKNIFSNAFYLCHSSGDKLYPIKMKNRDTGAVAFRVSLKGNTKTASIEVASDDEMKRYVLEHGYAVRASTLDKKRHGLFKVGQRSIESVVEKSV